MFSEQILHLHKCFNKLEFPDNNLENNTLGKSHAKPKSCKQHSTTFHRAKTIWWIGKIDDQ